MEYISKEDVLSKLYLSHKDVTYIDKNAAADRIKKIPSIGIVRCKECKWYGNEQKKIYECCTYWAQDGGVLVPTKADDFCSYGERKESE